MALHIRLTRDKYFVVEYSQFLLYNTSGPDFIGVSARASYL